jgi:glycine cleavage system H protein
VPDELAFTVGKFTFATPTDRLYHPAGLWVRQEGNRLVVGVTDYWQQRSGDIAFASVVEAGVSVKAGERLATIETIKVSSDLPAPVSGAVVETNPMLELEAEIVNQAPYGAGWLAILAPSAWDTERAGLMSAKAYHEQSYHRAQEEAGLS